LGKPKISKVALAVGAATILWTVISIFRVIADWKRPVMLFIAIPWAAAGIALTVRSLRGSLRWPRGVAIWAGGFLIGMPAFILVPILSGPTDSTGWVLHIFFGTLFIVLGILLIRVGFKR
jgi:hypothetical protein